MFNFIPFAQLLAELKTKISQVLLYFGFPIVLPALSYLLVCTQGIWQSTPSLLHPSHFAGLFVFSLFLRQLNMEVSTSAGQAVASVAIVAAATVAILILGMARRTCGGHARDGQVQRQSRGGE